MEIKKFELQFTGFEKGFFTISIDPLKLQHYFIGSDVIELTFNKMYWNKKDEEKNLLWTFRKNISDIWNYNELLEFLKEFDKLKNVVKIS